MTEGLFWGSVTLIAYCYFGYPLVVHILARNFPKAVNKSSETPEVTILVVAYNEEKHVGTKIENLLCLDYPREKISIQVASDASTDTTDEIVKSFAIRGVGLLRMDQRLGKAEILNRVVPHLETEIVILSDARQVWSNGAILSLVSNMADPDVGGVCGELVLRTDATRGGFGEGIGFYWEYEKFIRRREAVFDSTCGTTGCMFALRRSLFETIPRDTLLDDFVIPMNITKRGKRIVFEERAIAYDQPEEEMARETKRKIRTLSGNYQAFFRMPWLFNPFRNRLFLQFVSHKVLRLLVPYLLVAMFASSLMLAGTTFYFVCFLVQVLFYGLALSPMQRLSDRLGGVKAFVVLNWVAFLALPVYISGRQKAAWK